MHPVLRPTPGAPDHYRLDAPQDLVDNARDFVATCTWTWAVTFADSAPHWYTLRRNAERSGNAGGYDALRTLVLDHHYLRSWHGRSFRAVALDGVLVWAMQHGGVLLNGMPASIDDFEQAPALFDHL